MSVNEIITELREAGLGGTDVLTDATVISGATLDESINGDGGLTVSWKSEKGGMIRGGTLFMGYVMKENYVPKLGSDGLYLWSPKFSEPAVLLSKNNYGKSLVMSFNSALYKKGAVAGTVVAVVANDSDLPSASLFDTGTLAIVTGSNAARLRKVISSLQNKVWYTSTETAAEKALYRLAGNDERYFRFVGGRWIDIGTGDGTSEETSTVYTSVFAGKLGTFVTDLNTWLAQHLPGFSIELRSEKTDPSEAADELYELRETFISVTFDGSTLKKLIDDIAEASEAHAYYIGRKIVIGKTKAYSDTDFFNRFIVLGGAKNMAKRTVTGEGYAPITQRLHLDEAAYPGSVIDLRSEPDKEAPFEAFLVFDDIYPKLNLTVRSARCRLSYLLDENGSRISDGSSYKLYAKWYVTFALDGQPYTIDKNYIIQDRPLSVLFQSGPLTGRQFELTLFESGKHEKDADDVDDSGFDIQAGECCIIFEADGELLLPGLPPSYEGGGLCPQTGNWVTLVNVAIEDGLRMSAQEELLQKGMERARLIYESKEPAIQEERSFTDALTGEGSEGVPGLGEPYKGYIVTGVSENLVTGAKTVSYGTFRPKGLVRSAIDKIESYTISGGEPTKGREVSTKTDGGTTVIYIHDGSEGGDNSAVSSGKGGSTGTTSQSQSKTIRQAGGNTNIKTVYEAIDAVSGEGGSSNVFAGLATELWEHRDSLQAKWSAVTLYFTNEQPPAGMDFYQYLESRLYYNGSEVTDSSLKEAFASAKAVMGDTTRVQVTAGSSFPAAPGKFDLLIESIETTAGGETIEGGIRVWMYNGAVWGVILTSTTSLVENLGDAVRLLVFGAADGSIPGMIEATGMLTTQNFVKMFSTAQSGGKTLAESLFGMGTLYHVEDQGTWRDVYYDAGDGKWYYTDTNPKVEYTGDVDSIIPYSFSKMSAEKIDFDGKEISLKSDDGTVFKDKNGNVALCVNGAGLVSMSSATMSSAGVTGNMVVADNRLWIHKLGSSYYHTMRSVKEVSGVFNQKAIIDMCMKEYTVSGASLPAVNSTFEMNSYKSDWATSLGYIRMECGYGNGTGNDDRHSEIVMGVDDGNGSIDTVKIVGSRHSDNTTVNMIAVRGRFAILATEGTYYGASGTFVDGNGNTITVKGGIITSATPAQ